MAMALRFAGSANQPAFETLVSILAVVYIMDRIYWRTGKRDECK